MNPSNLTGPIQVICNGSDLTEKHIPKFNGRNINPNEYLQRLKRYYQRSLERQPRVDHLEHLKDVLEISFEGPASRWLQLIKQNIIDWDTFATEFISKYWSREVQRGIRNKIENEKYRPQGNLTRTEYFTERVLLLQSITPTMTEEEIVTLLSERFDTLIQDSVNVQNITTIKQFEKLLQREDIREGPKKNRQNQHNHNDNNDRPGSPNKNRYSHDNAINNRAYQPKWYQQNHNTPRNETQDSKPYQNRQQNTYRPEFNNNRPHRDYKPYQTGNRYPPRQEYYQSDQKKYPTREQEQVLAIVSQNDPRALSEAMRHPPPPINNSTNSASSPTQQEN